MPPEQTAANHKHYKRPYQLLIFDWDGTLMDSSARIVRCIHHAAAAVDLPVVNEQEIRHVIGLSLAVAVERLYPDMPTEQFEVFAEAFHQQSLGDELAAAAFFPGTQEVLQTLASQGYALAVATGKSRRGLNQDMLMHNVMDLFPVSRTADETFSKPHPQMLEEILTDYDLNVADALMIGDTEYDVQMAMNAGVDALAVSYGVHSAERLLKLQPQGLIDNILQLPDWLQQQG